MDVVVLTKGEAAHILETLHELGAMDHGGEDSVTLLKAALEKPRDITIKDEDTEKILYEQTKKWGW